MIPPFSFREIVEEERIRDDKSIFAGIGSEVEEALTREQSQDLRISDVGTCALQLWAKVNGEFTLSRDPMTTMTRLDPGSMFGAYLGRLYKAGCARRGVEVILEQAVEYDLMPGHIDILLPEYKHVYDIKSNYDSRKYEKQSSHRLQVGTYGLATFGDDFTASIVAFRLAVQSKDWRLFEYEVDQENLIEDTKAESFRLRRAAGSMAPPEPDIDPKKTWMCKYSCLYAACSRNANASKGTL